MTIRLLGDCFPESIPSISIGPWGQIKYFEFKFKCIYNDSQRSLTPLPLAPVVMLWGPSRCWCPALSVLTLIFVLFWVLLPPRGLQRSFGSSVAATASRLRERACPRGGKGVSSSHCWISGRCISVVSGSQWTDAAGCEAAPPPALRMGQVAQWRKGGFGFSQLECNYHCCTSAPPPPPPPWEHVYVHQCFHSLGRSLMEVKATTFITAAAVRWLSPSVVVQRLTEAQKRVHPNRSFYNSENLLWLSCWTVSYSLWSDFVLLNSDQQNLEKAFKRFKFLLLIENIQKLASQCLFYDTDVYPSKCWQSDLLSIL